MTIPNPLSAAQLRAQGKAPVVKGFGARPEAFGRVHAIPVPDSERAAGGVIEALYRVFERTIASLGLIVSLPLMLAVAVVVRLDSPGPALFRHKRPARSVCRRGRELEGRPDLISPPGGYDPDALYYVPAYFTLVKFRTMYHDARTRFPGCFPAAYAREDFRSQFPHVKNDPRVTRVGRVLRKLSVDELPNLWSVVIGEMRLVGPRPEAPEVLQVLHPRGNDQVYPQAGDHRPRADQRPRVAQLGRDDGLGPGIRPDAQRRAGSENHLADDQARVTPHGAF